MCCIKMGMGHIYIVTRDLIDLPSYKLLSEYDTNRITKDMILDTITVYHSDVNCGYFEITFPQESNHH